VVVNGIDHISRVAHQSTSLVAEDIDIVQQLALGGLGQLHRTQLLRNMASHFYHGCGVLLSMDGLQHRGHLLHLAGGYGRPHLTHLELNARLNGFIFRNVYEHQLTQDGVGIVMGKQVAIVAALHS
jgi:hypothetical protein